MLRQNRGKFAGKLFQHPGEIGTLRLQHKRCQVKTCNIKKFVDQFLQALCLFQRNTGVARSELRRNLWLIHQKIQISDHTGKRRLQIMRQIDDHVILALFRLLGELHIAKGLLPRQIQFILCLRKLRRKHNRLLHMSRQLLCRTDDIIEIAQRFSDGKVSKKKRYNHNGRHDHLRRD